MIDGTPVLDIKSAPPEDLLEMGVDQLFEVEETGGEDRP